MSVAVDNSIDNITIQIQPTRAGGFNINVIIPPDRPPGRSARHVMQTHPPRGTVAAMGSDPNPEPEVVLAADAGGRTEESLAVPSAQQLRIEVVIHA